MKAFSVTIRTGSQFASYTALAISAFDAWEAAFDRHGMTSISVRPA